MDESMDGLVDGQVCEQVDELRPSDCRRMQKSTLTGTKGQMCQPHGLSSRGVLYLF